MSCPVGVSVGCTHIAPHIREVASALWPLSAARRLRKLSCGKKQTACTVDPAGPVESGIYVQPDEEKGECFYFSHFLQRDVLL